MPFRKLKPSKKWVKIVPCISMLSSSRLIMAIRTSSIFKSWLSSKLIFLISLRFDISLKVFHPWIMFCYFWLIPSMTTSKNMYCQVKYRMTKTKRWIRRSKRYFLFLTSFLLSPCFKRTFFTFYSFCRCFGQYWRRVPGWQPGSENWRHPDCHH